MIEAKEKDEETTSSNNGDLEREIGDQEDEEAWGTWEEFLLASAVKRHGTNSWDSIANELKKCAKHSSSNNNNNGGGGGEVDVKDGKEIPVSGFSSQNCHRKYVHLKRRFHDEQQQEDEDDGDEHLRRMVDKLRKLRVDELKRELHRRDVSIVSLQLKVKKLEEERESVSKVKEEEVLNSDLRIKPEINATGLDERPVEPERSSPDKVAAAADSAENRSCNESNSTNHHDNIKKVDSNKNNSNNIITKDVVTESKLKREPEESGLIGPESIKNKNSKKRNEPVVVAAERKVSRLSESLSESRRESAKQQSSEVQSSASLSKKKRRRFRGGGDSGDELEAEEVSPANKRINAKSQPLVRFLETLRSHKHGSVFQRRLPSQETEKYRNVIRQHMDLDTAQSRLDKGIYCDCHPKFYRDLLLIFTNAVLFYRKSSAEHIAARELRRLVMDEVATRKPNVQPKKPDPETQHLEPVVKKPRSSSTMVVCRRRSSSSMQALSESMKKGGHNNSISTITKNGLVGKVENGREEKSKKLDNNGNDNDNGNGNGTGSPSSKKEKVGAEGNLKKLLTRERSNLGNGGLRLSSNNGKKIISKDVGKREKVGNVSKDESSEGEGVRGMEKKRMNVADSKQDKGTPIVLKKQGVADFLKRMKQNSPSSQEKASNNNGSEEEENVNEEKGGRREKNPSANNSNVKKTSVNVKKNVKEVDVETGGASRRSLGRRGEAEAAASRRGIGRPPKRKAAMMSGNTPDSAKGGRTVIKDGGEKSKKKPRR